MDFVKYPSITNSYQEKFLDRVKIYCSHEDWCVQEKVHGANFAFYSDGKTVQCASRSGLLGENASFYNFKPVLEKYRDSVLSMAREGERNNIIIYGELCGGAYKGHKSGSSQVQKGVQYHPENEFVAFDVVVDGEYQDFMWAMRFCHLNNIPVAPVLYRGTLDKCLEYPNTFLTSVPGIFGLDDLEGNTCEGVVIRPNKNLMIGESRVILKNKNSEFSEKTARRAAKTVQEFPEELRSALEEVLQYINLNRVAAVASKIGVSDEDVKQFQKLVGLTIQDALEEAGEVEFYDLPSTSRKLVSREINAAVVPFVKEYFNIR